MLFYENIGIPTTPIPVTTPKTPTYSLPVTPLQRIEINPVPFPIPQPQQLQEIKRQRQKMALLIQLQKRQDRMLSLLNEIPSDDEFTEVQSQLIQQQKKCKEQEVSLTEELLDEFRKQQNITIRKKRKDSLSDSFSF